MRILTSGIATASFVALALGACGNDGGATSSGGGPPPDGYCAQFASCSSCTPVSGCGWCYNADGTGNCAADPDLCATSTSSFAWTWNPSGCRVVAEAGIAPGPGDASAAATDEASSHPGDATDGASSPDAAGETRSSEGGGDAAGSSPTEAGGG